MGAPAAPQFTVILPTHNRADVLPYAIQSALAQTLADFELFIVGDGCTDDTAAVVATFTDPRIRWFDLPKAPNFGYANRNIALRQARGDLIAYLPHDDLWFPDHLATLAAHFTDPTIDLAYSRTVWVDRAGLITPAAFNLHDPDTRRAFLALAANNISATNVIHRRSCLTRFGEWDETLPRNGDWELWGRIITQGGEQNFVYDPTPTGLHFRAIWKTDTQLGPPELYHWRDLRAAGVLPTTYPTTPVAPGEPEQATAWRALHADPLGEVARLRREITQALDHCAGRTDLLVLVEGQRAEIAHVRAALQEQFTNATHFSQALQETIVYANERDAALQEKTAYALHLEGLVHECEALLQAKDTVIAAHAAHINRVERRLPVRLYRRLRALLP